METIAAKKVRIFRGEEKILNILNEFEKSNLSAKAFCERNNIASGTFHNWKKKFSGISENPDRQPGFAALQVTAPADTALFAELRGLRIYQPVPASYLKELLS